MVPVCLDPCHSVCRKYPRFPPWQMTIPGQAHLGCLPDWLHQHPPVPCQAEPPVSSMRHRITALDGPGLKGLAHWSVSFLQTQMHWAPCTQHASTRDTSRRTDTKPCERTTVHPLGRPTGTLIL